jgi:hypothetical protein
MQALLRESDEKLTSCKGSRCGLVVAVVVGLDGAAVDVDAVAVDVGAALAMLSFAPRLACGWSRTRLLFHFRLALSPSNAHSRSA